MSTLSIILPLLLMASLGYFFTVRETFTKEHIAGISQFTFYLSIPAFLFINMYQADLAKSFDPKSLASFYLPVLLIYAVSATLYAWLNRDLPSTNTPSVVFGLGCSYSNTILVGLPVIVGALGEAMIGNVFAIITFHSALLFSLTLVIGHKQDAEGVGLWSLLKGIVFNPIVLSLSAGLALNLLQIPLVDELANGLTLLSTPALACALFVLGANLSFYKISQDWQLALTSSLIKLVLLPLCVYLVGLYGFNLGAENLAVVVLLSASPLGVNAYLIAMQVKALQSVIASTVVLSTMLSVITMSIWLAILL
ncbi:malonate transporter [Shewanella sairae]|uniref:Malonate transporter n=1 Tax=Shewanella sairae TaxID=190310 RepID=A0ABQ4PKN4_9GAMM|nr:AEC family transporter [Shewanella sairae]MCL1129475.1 AEC family transporter [Shewanella sairae]GIU48517.1 malonate transporter [Shewanella sairae]